ncbi:MAG: LysM peptidoglycan-binding domain-containing protein [Treponema sp.]|nr:LysM peptidoglycan-binding domain-containing protein [Treponema sp.]
MKTIGIKLADGTFYPILEEGEAKSRTLDVTTVRDNQTKVQIDLYRSETNSMTDAEYVDTLEVSNLEPHPNGEPDLHLSVTLDENNELKAEVIDAETGKKSEVQVQLVSRTLAEREASDVDFSLPETGIAASELAALETQQPTSEPQPPVEEDKTDEFITDDFSFDDFTDEEFASKEQKKASENSEQAEKEIDASASDDNLAATTSLDDITLDLPPLDDFDSFTSDKTDAATETTDDFALDSEESKADDMFDMTDFSLDEPVSDTTATVAETTESTETSEVTETNAFADTTQTSETAETTTFDSDTSLDDISLDLPDFDDSEFDTDSLTTSTKTETKTEIETETKSSDNLDEMDFTLPDFDDTTSDFSSETVAETSSDKTSDSDDLDNLFDDPVFNNDDFNSTTTQTAAVHSATSTATAASGSAMDFSDLYDDETLAGEHSTPYDEDAGDEVKRKTRVPVIICVVCAIICIIATLLVLFIIPSKYNLIKSRNTKKVDDSEWVKPKAEITLDETPMEENLPPPVETKEPEPIPVEEPEPQVPSVVETDAQEDKIVVAPKPNIVPVPAEKPKVKKDVRYRIKWGDTLWDISDSYYKNPWKYPKIAKYNHIKNPDLIISGTDILIPEE